MFSNLEEDNYVGFSELGLNISLQVTHRKFRFYFKSG